MGFQYWCQGATKLTMNKKYSKRIYGYTDMDPSICSVGWEAPAGTLATKSNVCSISWGALAEASGSESDVRYLGTSSSRACHLPANRVCRVLVICLGFTFTSRNAQPRTCLSNCLLCIFRLQRSLLPVIFGRSLMCDAYVLGIFG